MRYLLLLLFAAQAFANSITMMEYSWDTPATPGSGFPLAVVSGNQVNPIQNVPVTALPAGLHKVYVRAFDDSTGWGQPHGEWVYKHAAMTPSNREILELQVWFDNGAATVYDVPDGASVQLIRNLPIASLSAGLHVLHVRARDNFGVWGQPQSEWVYKHAAMTPSNREVVELQIWFDNGVATIYDVPDAADVQLIRNLPIASLSAGLHILNVRARDNFGVWGQAKGEWVYKFAQPANDSLEIVQVELQVDAQPATYFDVTDTSFVQLITNLPANSMGLGPHMICARYQDERGIWSARNCRNFFVIPGSINPNAGHIAGAECWINVDPGEGNGLALLPDDGQWDEQIENAYLNIADIPMGIHKLGVRVRDDIGQWSNVVLDTFSVGPLLVISTSGSNVILNWTASQEPHTFDIWRSTQVNSGFNTIATTSASTYTDSGVINTLPQAYYYVTFELPPGAENEFRLPAAQANKR